MRSRRLTKDSFRGNVGGPKDPINSSALLQQVCWKWFANEFCMTLGARDYNSFVVRYACDPFPIKSLALVELFETDGIKCHDQDIADFLPRQDRHFHVDQRLARDDTDHEVRNMRLLGVEYTLR